MHYQLHGSIYIDQYNYALSQLTSLSRYVASSHSEQQLKLKAALLFDLAVKLLHISCHVGSVL